MACRGTTMIKNLFQGGAPQNISHMRLLVWQHRHLELLCLNKSLWVLLKMDGHKTFINFQTKIVKICAFQRRDYFTRRKIDSEVFVSAWLQINTTKPKECFK